MTFEQGAIIAILLAMLVAYASERFKVEAVAITGLAAAFAVGVVPVQSVFGGFSSPAVITVIEVLLIAGVLAKTRVMDGFARRVIAAAPDERTVILLLGGLAAAISVFMNNIGALALVFPVAMSVCTRLGIAPAKVLMALSFATLLGGMCSLTGTPANLVVNEWVVEETGRSLAYFELALVGGPVALVGLLLLVVLAPRVFAGASAGAGDAHDGGPFEYVVERVVTPGSTLIGMHLPDLERAQGIAVHAVIRNRAHVFARRGDIVVAAGDVLVIEGHLTLLDELEEAEDLQFVNGGNATPDQATLEFVVMPDSLLLGSRVEDLAGHAQSDLAVLAVASRRGRIEGRLADVQLAMGDVLLLAGERDDMRRLAAECGLLALSPRRTARPGRGALAGIATFALGVLATALGLLPTEIAFGAVILVMTLTGQLALRGALQDVNWTIVILLACMIPLGAAVSETGAARMIADGIAEWLPARQPLVIIIVMLMLAVTITPFVDNVSTAIVLSPIAVGLAARTGMPAEPLLIAVAIGASLDFLTPFGHHNNAVVMGAGGYRFSDFARLGSPLTFVSIVVATAAFAVLLAW